MTELGEWGSSGVRSPSDGAAGTRSEVDTQFSGAPSAGGGTSLAALCAALLALVLLALGVPGPTRPQWQVLMPLLVVVGILVLFGRTLRRQSGALPFDDLGFLHVGIVSLYVLLPLGVFLALGLEYTLLNDARLYTAAPSPELVGRIGWYHVAYLASMSAVYYVVAGRTRAGTDRRGPTKIRMELALAAAIVWALFEILLVALGFFYRLSPSSYLDSYVLLRNLPLFARQIYRLASGVVLVARLVVLVWLFSDYPRRRWLLVIWLLVAGLETVLGGGSRTALMVLITGSFFLYHRFVRPWSFRVAAVGSVVVILAFTALGFVRLFRGVEVDVAKLGVGSGEFDAVFANAVDLDLRRTGREYRLDRTVLLMSEILAPVPSQLLPFQKIDLGDWYLRSFYPDMQERGEGFAFGVVPQSIVGFGWPEILVRGALIGWLFGLLTRWYRRAGSRAWVAVAYLWFAVMSYQSFRNTSLSLFSTFAQQFLPAVLLLWAVSRSIVAGVRPTPTTMSSVGEAG